MSQKVDIQVLIATIKTISDITDIVTHDGLVNIYWQFVPEGVKLPYVVLYYQHGGKIHSTKIKAGDTTYKVVGYSTNQLEVINLSEGLYKLDGMTAVIPDDYPNLKSMGLIQQVIPVYETKILQNTTYHCVGGHYRLRLTNYE